jgi:hypothetical protein
VELIQEIGSYAGFAAVIGLAVLSALYFSQARDVRRLRDWAGRAPERAAEIEAGGRAAAAVPVAARPQPQVRPAGEGEAAGAPAAAAQPAAAAGAAGAAAASAGASPATAAAGAPAGNGTEEGADQAAAEAEPAESGDEERTGVAPAAATAAGAVASAGTAERSGTAEPGTAVRPPGAAPAAPGETGTGAKVLPARRPVPPVRPRPTIPPRTVPPRSGQPSVLGQAPGSRPQPRGGRKWPEPRYIVLIVAGVIILGLGGTVGVLQLTKDDPAEEPATRAPDTDVGDPTEELDRPEPVRVNPADVTVTVLNATNTTGLAVRVLSQLENAGYQKGNTGNAAERQRAESVVMYKPGATDEARAVARRLDISSIEPIDDQARALSGVANVVVVLGADKANQ